MLLRNFNKIYLHLNRTIFGCAIRSPYINELSLNLINQIDIVTIIIFNG